MIRQAYTAAAATSALARTAQRNRRADKSPVRIDPLLRREGTSRNGWQSTADALLTMELLRQPVAAGGNGSPVFAVSRVSRFASDCGRLQPRGPVGTGKGSGLLRAALRMPAAGPRRSVCAMSVIMNRA